MREVAAAAASPAAAEGSSVAPPIVASKMACFLMTSTCLQTFPPFSSNKKNKWGESLQICLGIFRVIVVLVSSLLFNMRGELWGSRVAGLLCQSKFEFGAPATQAAT